MKSSTFYTKVLIFTYMGCFFFSCSSTTYHHHHQKQQTKRRKISTPTQNTPSPTMINTTNRKSISIKSYIKHIFISFTKFITKLKTTQEQQHSYELQDYQSIRSQTKYTVSSRRHLLDVHRISSHSLSDLCADDSAYNVLAIIFKSGWKRQSTPSHIHQIIKIKNSPRALDIFEDYRAAVQNRRHKNGDGRCAADGNERLRFFCSTALCSLRGGTCRSPYCCTCGIVRHGFAGKRAKEDGIATYATSWDAHASLPDDLESEFAFLEVRRAMVVCRVVAGRIGRGEDGGDVAAFDSMFSRSRRAGGEEEEEELVVYSARAVLPCFVVVYSAG